MRIFALPALIALAILGAPSVAVAADAVGVVLLHGKTGTPGQMARVSAALTAAGHRPIAPEMCWSDKRIFDKKFDDCLGEVDAAAARLRMQGATRIVIAGMSQGAVAAIAYGATRKGLAGVVAMAPAADPTDLARYPGLAAAIKTASDLVKAGQGDKRTELGDIISGGKDIAFTTTPNIYLSFHAPGVSIATMPNLIAQSLPKLGAPLLWVAGTADPSQAIAERGFAAAPKMALGRLVKVDADHGGTANAAIDAVLAWLKTLP
jgi:pimeloyl-ACP methyl ester carboxylesterase